MSFLYLFPLLGNEESNAPAANSTSIFFSIESTVLYNDCYSAEFKTYVN